MLDRIKQLIAENAFTEALHQACLWAESDHDTFMVAALSENAAMVHEILLLAADWLEIAESVELNEPASIARGITFLEGWASLVRPAEANDFFWKELSPKFHDEDGFLISTYVREILPALSADTKEFEQIVKLTWDFVAQHVRPGEARGSVRGEILQILVNLGQAALCAELLFSTRDPIPNKWVISVCLARQLADLKVVEAGICAIRERLEQASNNRDLSLAIEAAVNFLQRAKASLQTRLELHGKPGEWIDKFVSRERAFPLVNAPPPTAKEVAEFLRNYRSLEDSLGPLCSKELINEEARTYANVMAAADLLSDEDLSVLSSMLGDLEDRQVDLIVQAQTEKVLGAVKVLSIPEISSAADMRKLIEPIMSSLTERILSIPEAARLLATAEIVWSRGSELLSRPGMELSHLICAYIKAVEVFVFDVIGQSCKGMTISFGPPGRVGRNTAIIAGADYGRATAGNLCYFIKNNPVSTLADPAVSVVVAGRFRDWVVRIRNSWAHRNSLLNTLDAEALRNETLEVLKLLAKNLK